MTTTRRILMCLMVLLMTILMFASCGKEEYDVPPAIQRIIDNGGYEDKHLILIDEYSYNDDVVYLCLYNGCGWFSSSHYVYVTTGDGFSIGQALGARADFHQYNPSYFRGCMGDFLANGKYIRGIYGDWTNL